MASAELRCALAWTRQLRLERWPWQPSHWSFLRLLPPALRYRLRCHFRQARARLRAVSQQPAAASRSACPAACTAPACGARPHGYPSYVPLRLTVGLDKRKVNGKAITARYGGNRREYGAGVEAVFERCPSREAKGGETVPRWGNGIRWIPLKIKSPALRRGHELSVLGEPTNQQANLSYPPISLRRNIPAIPTSPVPSRPKVPGSGTVMFVIPWTCPIPW